MLGKELREKYPYQTELHAHTSPVSDCADFSPAETVAFYRERGCHSLVIANHLHFKQANDCHERAAEQYLADYEAACEAGKKANINVILGVEIRFAGSNNDYLVYGVSPDDILRFIQLVPDGIENFYRKVKNAKNIILQAHPFRRGITRAPLSAIDGIEAYNLHPDHNSGMGIAARYAREHDLIVSGGTDFHHLGHEAMCLMRTEGLMRDSYDVAEALKSRNVIFDCSGSLILPYCY